MCQLLKKKSLEKVEKMSEFYCKNTHLVGINKMFWAGLVGISKMF